jgi:Ca-activated chloride channel homolog
MNINPDDPKWTAYVLGELNDAERAQVEKELESSAVAREVVEEIRLATDLLRHELTQEQAVALAPEQRRAITTAAAPPVEALYKRPGGRRLPLQFSRPMFRWAGLAASVAAGLLIVATLSVPSLRSRRATSVAQETAVPARESQREESASKDKDKINLAALSRDKLEAARKTSEAAGAVQESLQVQQWQQGQQGQQGQQPQQSAIGGSLRAVTAGTLGQDQIDSLPVNGRRVDSPLPLSSLAENKTLPTAPPAGAPAAVAADRVIQPPFNTETYDLISDNPFIRVAQDSLATFSIDVDTASYANIRRFLSMNQLPPKDSVRIEEMINYFSYDYPSPNGQRPIATYTEVAAAPWKPEHRLVRIGIKGKDIDMDKRPPSNLVFLVDVSGSMATPEKLPMLKTAMKLMVEKLGERDHVAIVTYAGASGVHLRSTSGDKKEVINSAIESLNSGGSTNGGAGILLAYETATSNFIRGGTNRVILATDGDFNVGITNQGDLIRLIEEKAKSGVFLSVLGFGMGNYKDSTLEKLADEGNGNYAYIDTMNEARKVLVEEMSGTLLTIAKDVKIQVEFNPAQVNAYRLIGYENRALRHQDFNDDKKDAGDMGAGQTVTALFEVVPRGVNDVQISAVDQLKYQQRAMDSAVRVANREILNVRVRYKEPDGNTSQLMETPVIDRGTVFNNASSDFRFAAAVASFGMVLRDSPHKGQSTMDSVIEIAEKSRGVDKNGYRDEFVQLARKARALKGNQ